MNKLLPAAVLCGVLWACSSSEDGASNGGEKGGSDSGGTGGAAPTGGMAGMGAQGGSAGMSGGSAGMSGGSAGAGGSSSDPNWPTYDDAARGPKSTKVLVLLLDFADSDQNQLVPNAEERWGSMIFGREHSNGNDYWYKTSGGQFQLLPAEETHLTPNNGVVHIKASANKPTTGVLVAEEQPWLTEGLDLAAEFVDFRSFDKDGDGILKNSELSVLFIINWEFEQIALAPAQANVLLSHPIAGTGVTLEKFARDMYLHTSIGIPMHELGHHVLDLDHTPAPTDHDLMGLGAYWPDPVVSTLHDPDWFNATRPTQLKAAHKMRAGWVTPTEITGSMQGVRLYAPELGRQYNVLKLPVVDGFLLLENRHAAGYDASIPFCNGEQGAVFVDEVAQYLRPHALTDVAPSTEAEFLHPFPTFCEVYSLAGHNDTFTHGGWRIRNVSAPGPIMTLDIEKLDMMPTIDHYTLETWWDDAGSRVRHQTRLDGSASTFDFSVLSGGTSITGFVSIGINAWYTTGEMRGVSLATTYMSDSPYLQVRNAGEAINGGCPTPYSLTYVTIDPAAPPVTSANVTFRTGTLEHTVTFTNLPQN